MKLLKKLFNCANYRQMKEELSEEIRNRKHINAEVKEIRKAEEYEDCEIVAIIETEHGRMYEVAIAGNNLTLERL